MEGKYTVYPPYALFLFFLWFSPLPVPISDILVLRDGLFQLNVRTYTDYYVHVEMYHFKKRITFDSTFHWCVKRVED